jgi:hypothetical protein
MRRIVFRLAALAGTLTTVAGCSGSPTTANQRKPNEVLYLDPGWGPLLEYKIVQDCISEGVCALVHP